MIIDCHGHYTTAPAQHQRFREAQLGWLADSSEALPEPPDISDDELAETLEENQLPMSRKRGIDLTLFSPRASAMEHHVVDPGIARAWARHNNDLIYRVVNLYPNAFVGVCQLPQTPSGSWDDAIDELDRCVSDLGFVGCNLNPDPSGGYWDSPPLTDKYWYPLYERMIELEVPAMIHASRAVNPALQGTGDHYLNADTTVFMQLLQGDLFSQFPELRLVIPHGGGAVPYHWGRYRGMAEGLGRPPIEDHLLGNVFFDTCVYHQAGVGLLLEVVPIENILFASEMLGAVRSIDSRTGFHYDDTKRYVDGLDISESERHQVFELNVRRVYPRLDAELKERMGNDLPRVASPHERSS
jgi:4-oxalmesaconate hydratase